MQQQQTELHAMSYSQRLSPAVRADDADAL